MERKCGEKDGAEVGLTLKKLVAKKTARTVYCSCREASDATYFQL
jgi:hypothetical protein